MVSSDIVKITLLGTLFLFCTGTLFTSSSFYTGDDGVGTLVALVEKLCDEPKKVATDCLSIGKNKKSPSNDTDENSSTCAKKLLQVTKCERAVAKAYQKINMNGCIDLIQASSICRSEWCELQGSGSSKSCKQECDPIKKKLDKCVQKHIKSSFANARLNHDGTMSSDD